MFEFLRQKCPDLQQYVILVLILRDILTFSHFLISNELLIT